MGAFFPGEMLPMGTYATESRWLLVSSLGSYWGYAVEAARANLTPKLAPAH